MDKTLIKIIIAVAVLFLLWQKEGYLSDRAAFQQLTSLPPDGKYTISIKYYDHFGRTVDVNDTADCQAIVQALGQLTFDGHTPTSNSVSPEDQAYSLQIYSMSQSPVYCLLSHKIPSYILDNDVGLKIGNPEEITQLVEEIYAKASQVS